MTNGGETAGGRDSSYPERTRAMPIRRNWLQFSLRTLLGVMLGASLLMGWVAYKRNEAAEQRRAYQLILDRHGASNFGPESARPPWVQWILGQDVAGTGGCIEFYGPEVSDADLAT